MVVNCVNHFVSAVRTSRTGYRCHADLSEYSESKVTMGNLSEFDTKWLETGNDQSLNGWNTANNLPLDWLECVFYCLMKII